MANLQTNSLLPDSSNKQDFYDLVENSTVINIVNADISASAAIAGSKLAQITTAGKVSGAALTSLSSTPSAAGALPVANIPSSIPYSKLTLTGAVLNADLAGSIADTKLSTISTAGKVSGASLTSLSSIPSGAGVIPSANLPSFGLSFVSATTFSNDTTKTITGLTTGIPYLLIVDLSIATANEGLLIYTNGTLSTIKATANYSSSNKFAFHNISSGLNTSSPTIGNWTIGIGTIATDTTKTRFVLNGMSLDSSGTFTNHSAIGIVDSDAALSSITIETGGSMTLTGTAYLYKYATS